MPAGNAADAQHIRVPANGKTWCAGIIGPRFDLVLVNGLPSSGKNTLLAGLTSAPALDALLISKNALTGRRGRRPR